MTTPALTAATEPGPLGLDSGRQSIEGIVSRVTWEAPAEGALGVVWVRLVSGSASILDVRGLVVWPGTAVVDGSVGPSAECRVPAIGQRVRAVASDADYWSIPPMFDALRIEIATR